MFLEWKHLDEIKVAHEGIPFRFRVQKYIKYSELPNKYLEKNKKAQPAGWTFAYSHSIVPVGLGVKSYNTLLTPGTSVTILLVI